MTEQLDCTGLRCPYLILKVSQAMRELRPGDQLEITADVLSFRAELNAYCKVLRHPVVSLEEQEGRLIARVQKRPTTAAA